MTGHTGGVIPFNCWGTYYDGSGHHVIIRTGRAGGFGQLHALLDHHVEPETIGNVITNLPAGTRIGKRFAYAAECIENGQAVIEFGSREDRNPSNDSPDDYALGIVTAYCNLPAYCNVLGAPGGEQDCPDWVDATP